MSALYAVVHGGKRTGTYERLEGRHMGAALDPLSHLARELQLPELVGFFGMDPKKSRSVTEMSTGELPALKWFDPAKALPTVRGLMKHLREHPDADLEALSDVLKELKTLEAILVLAQKNGAKFHLIQGP